MKRTDRELIRMAEAVLDNVARLPSLHRGDKDEREQNDMEDAFSNGCDVGHYEAYLGVKKVVQPTLTALKRRIKSWTPTRT